MSERSNHPLGVLRGMDATRRFLVLGGAAVAIALVWAVGQWAASPTFVTLYQELDLKESARIEEQLKKNDIPFRFAGGGTEVLVPASEAAAARVALAREGLPSSGRPGLELFDKPTWGMTDFTQRVTYQRALEGELARTISSIRGIDRAEVHLVMPVSSPLRRNERPASASVVLTLKNNTTLTRETIQGIAYIVSNSVEQLSSENVAVMDNAGSVLTMPASAAGSGAMTGRQMDVLRSVEQRYEEKIEDLLTTVLGYGHSRAKVSAELSFDQTDRTVETFDPDGQVLQTEQRSEGGAADGSGTPQTIVSNAYQNSRRLEKVSSGGGDVHRLTVAVLVDEKSMREAGASVSITRLEGMVRDAIGADSTRGDRVSVLSVPFEVTAPPPGGAATTGPAPKMDVMRVVERGGRPVVGVVAIVALLLLAFRAIGSVGGGAAPAKGAAPAMDPLIVPSSGTNPSLVGGRGGESNDRTETTAQVLRAWLSENS